MTPSTALLPLNADSPQLRLSARPKLCGMGTVGAVQVFSRAQREMPVLVATVRLFCGKTVWAIARDEDIIILRNVAPQTCLCVRSFLVLR